MNFQIGNLVILNQDYDTGLRKGLKGTVTGITPYIDRHGTNQTLITVKSIPHTQQPRTFACFAFRLDHYIPESEGFRHRAQVAWSRSDYAL